MRCETTGHHQNGNVRKYKTPERARQRAKTKRDAIKARGGAEYAALLKKEREARAGFRKKNPRYWKTSERRNVPFKTWLCSQARKRGRKKGLAATIRPGDIVWPTHCPVLGIKLDYPERSGQRKDLFGIAAANYPSLDRWDCSLGYVPGNVFVISFRANTLKSNAKLDEIMAVARYLQTKPASAL